jgi:hypothetical protein
MELSDWCGLLGFLLGRAWCIVTEPIWGLMTMALGAMSGAR